MGNEGTIGLVAKEITKKENLNIVFERQEFKWTIN